MINIKDYVSNLDLYIGQTYRSTCPVCSRKNTFTVTNDNGTLVWNCYANSCTLRGKLGVGLRVEDIRKLMHGSKDKEDVPFVLPEWIVNASMSETVELYLQSWTKVRWLMLSEGSLIHRLLTVPRSGKGMAILAERTLVGRVRQLSLSRTVSQLPKRYTFSAQDSLSWGQHYSENTSSNYKVTHVS
jgi:hypothetical protein